MMKKLSYKEFVEWWEKAHILEVQSTADKMFGKDVRGQADNPQGYIMVYCIVPVGALEKKWWQFWKR